MPFQHPEEIGYGYVIKRYAARKDSGHARYLILKGGRFLRPEWPHAQHFAHHLIDDAATITDAELEALLGYEWRSRLTAAWLVGVDRRDRFRERIGDLLLASEVCFSGSAYCFALARFGTHADPRSSPPTSTITSPAPTSATTSPQPLAPSSALTPTSAPTTPTASPSPTASGTSGSMPCPTCAATRATCPTSRAAGRTCNATSPTAGLSRRRSPRLRLHKVPPRPRTPDPCGCTPALARPRRTSSWPR